MNEKLKSKKAADETAEKILTAIYGEDLHNCHTRIQSISAIIQETLTDETETHQMMLDALIEAIRKIHILKAWEKTKRNIPLVPLDNSWH
ncbi:MAG: hypothetical protein ACR2H1_03530 [Limisphaerales bacterium]